MCHYCTLINKVNIEVPSGWSDVEDTKTTLWEYFINANAMREYEEQLKQGLQNVMQNPV